MNKSIKFFREIEDNRKNKGFSMAEMLIVVALIILTLSIAIPNVLSYKRNMELMHADDVAREIFLSAQNELVYQKSVGQLTDIYTSIVGSCQAANNHSDNQPSLYYMKSDSDAMRRILGEKKLDAISAGGYYYIEVEPSSANVYSVFYTEKDITWDELNATANGLRNKEGRRKYYSQAVVGYYAAKLEDLEYAEAEHIKLGNLSIINSEELYVEFDVYVRNDVLSNDTKLTLTLLDEQEHSQVDTISLSTPANENGLCVEKGPSEFFDENGVSKLFQKYTVRKLIDSMEEAYRFKSCFSEFSLGSTITAAVSFKYEGVSEGKNVKEEISGSAVSNSSFAQVIIDSTGFNSVGIRYIRHLYNIQDYGLKASYIQVATLDFEADNYFWKEGKYYNNTNEATQNSALNPLKGGGDVFSKYHGVTLPKESEYLGNGNRGNIIKNFKSDRGIFSEADSCELSEIYVVNHQVKTTADVTHQVKTPADVTTAGGLIGSAQGGSIRNCRVYQENGESFMDASAGSSADLCVGGLAGKVNGVAIEQSCAAIPVVSASAGYCGGLVGFAKESAFSKCYGNTTDLKGKYAGGFAGYLENCTVSDCYAVAESYEDTVNAAGFCADMNGGSLRESYALIGSIKTSKTPTERIALIQDNSGTTVDKCYFNYDGKFEATQKEKGESAAYNEIVEKLSSEDVWEYDYNDNGSIKSLEFSKPFHTEDDYEYMENAAYTCLRIKGMPHYGNWPDASCTIEYLPNLESIGLAEEVSYKEGVKERLEGFHSRKILTSGSIADSGLRDYVWEGNYPEKTVGEEKVKYVFKCWKVSGTDKVYYPGDPIEVSGNSLVLMAQWVPGITITYDTNANDKAKFFGEKSYDDPHLRYEGEEVEILFTDNKNRQPIHNQGYQFIGWNDKDSKNNHPPKFTYVLDGNESDWGKTHMEVKEDGTHTITLYAYWENPPKESHLTIRVNDELSHYEDLGLTLRGGIPVEYAQKPGDYFVNAKTGQYDLLLRGNETGIKVVVDSSGARFVQNGKTLQLLDLYTLKVKYRLNGTYQNWINFHNTDRLKLLFTLDHIDIDGESFSLEDIGNDWVYESPVMLPGSEFAIYVNEPVEINEAAKICKGTTPNAENIATKSIYLRPSSGNVVKGPVTVYADYCSIEFKSPDEWPVQTLPPTVIVRGGSNYRCPTDELVSSKKGIFLGWSSLGDGEAGRISVSPGGYIYMEDNKELILYARWKDSIQVTYETNFYKKGHDDVPECNINDIIKKVKGDAFYEAKPLDEGNYACTHLVYTNQSSRIHTVLPTKLQRAGYYFVGWGTSPYAYDGGTTYWPGSQVALEDDLVLYAQWAYNKNYTIVYLMSEEEFSSGVSNTTFPETNSVVTLALNRYSRAGKEFTGWHGYRNGSANQNNSNYKVDFDAGAEYSVEQLKACKEPNSNLIILYGSWKDLEEKDSYQVEFKLDKMKPSQYSLYAYAGQNYTAVLECEGGYRPPDTISVLVKGMELDPKSDYNWNPTTRKVTIYADAIRGPVTIIGAAIPEKHSFSYLNVKENGDTEILYKEDVQYNTYNAIKSIEEIGAEEHIPAGCLFTGWNTKKDGSGTMYKPGDSIFIQGEVNLYACWKKSDVVGAGIYNGYLFYYGISANKHYYLARGETQTIEDGETLAVINDGGQVHFTKSNNQYTYYYCIMLQKQKELSKYTIGISRDDGRNYVNVEQEELLSLDTNSSDSLKNAFGDNKISVFEYGDSAYDYYYFTDTVSGIPEITNIKITEAEENGKSAIFDFANSLRPTNSQSSESINGSSDCFRNRKKYPKVDVYNGSVPRIDRSYANFFKNKDCRLEFRVHLDANNEKYKYNSINLVDENGISVTTRNNLIKATDGQDYIFNPDAMAELRSGTYTVIFDYSDYQNDPSFELHVYDEDLMGYRYIQMEIKSLMAYCPGAGSSESSTWYYAQFADVAFYGDDKRISQYKFEDASCVYLDNDGWSSSNKYEDISMIIDNNPRTKMCSRQKIGSTMQTGSQKDSWIKLVIDVGDGYQFSPNIYGYTGLITAGDGGNYPWRMPNTFGFYGTNDSLNKPDINWELIDGQTLYDAKLESATNKDYIKPKRDTWLNNVPFYTFADDGKGENEMSGEWTKKLQTWLRQYLPYNVVDTPPRGDGKPLEYDMQPTPPHRIRSYSLTYNTNAPEEANITWYDPKNPTDPKSGNLNLKGEYGDQIIGFCIPQWKDSNGKTVKYFLGWSKDKNAREADYTSGSHINLITDTTLYAVWSEISPTFALTYHANDSESAPAVNMPVNTSGSGKCKISPLIPEREGYKFIGWIWLGDVDNDHTVQDDPFKEDNLGLYQPSDSILLNQNVTLYARWVKSKCVTVIAPGCKITSPGWTMGSNGYKYYVPVRSSCSFTYSIEEGVEFKSISVMNKKGDSFTNFINSEKNGVYSCTIPKVTEDLTVNIKVQTKKFNVQVTGVDSIILQDTKEVIVGENKVVSFEVSYGETAAFYFKASGSVSVRGTTGAIVTKEYYDNAEYYLCRIPKVYDNLNLSVVEGICVVLQSSADATYSITVYIPKGENSILPTADMVGFLAPEGQRFAGWRSSGNEEIVYPGGVEFNATSLADGTILYPHWAAEDTCTITIDYGYDIEPGSKTVKKGSWVVLEIPEREDWLFDGWIERKNNIDEPVSSSGFVAESDMTVIAQWKEIRKVWFDGNGGTPFEDVRIVADGSALGELPKAVWGEGEKILLHWKTSTDEMATKDMKITSDIVLKAEWVDAVKYHLDPERPEEYVCSDTKANQDYQTLTYASISDGYTRDDALFIGWADSPDLRASNVKYYREGDTVSDGTTDLYAVWLSGTLYFERQCDPTHPNLKTDLDKCGLSSWPTGKKLFYRIALDLNQTDDQFKKLQIGSPTTDNEKNTSTMLDNTTYTDWWNCVIVPDTITGGYKNWEVKVYIPDHKQSAPQYYPNESNGKSPMIEGKSKTWSIGSSKLGSKNCASYGIRDDGIVEVTISFGKIKEGKYLYQKTIPFGKAVNVDEIKKDDSDNENIVIFPYSPAPTALQEVTGVTETPEVTDTTEVTETQESTNASEVQEVTNIQEITEVTVP